MIPNILGRETVLLALVGGPAETGFLVRHQPEPRRFAERDRRHRRADPVDLLLIETRHLAKREMRGLDRVARFLL